MRVQREGRRIQRIFKAAGRRLALTVTPALALVLAGLLLSGSTAYAAIAPDDAGIRSADTDAARPSQSDDDDLSDDLDDGDRLDGDDTDSPGDDTAPGDDTSPETGMDGGAETGTDGGPESPAIGEVAPLVLPAALPEAGAGDVAQSAGSFPWAATAGGALSFLGMGLMGLAQRLGMFKRD